MTLTIQLTPDAETRLALRAADVGKTPADVAAELLERELLSRPLTLAELMAPVRKEVEENGMTDEELDAFFQEVRDEVWQDWKRQGKA